MIKSSAYRNSQAAEHMSTELVGLQIEHTRDRLHEKTEECKALHAELKCKQMKLDEVCKRQTELEAANKTQKDTIDFLNEKVKAAIDELERTQEEINDKMSQFEKERDEYKHKLEESEKYYTRRLSEQSQ